MEDRWLPVARIAGCLGVARECVFHKINSKNHLVTDSPPDGSFSGTKGTYGAGQAARKTGNRKAMRAPDVISSYDITEPVR